MGQISREFGGDAKIGGISVLERLLQIINEVLSDSGRGPIEQVSRTTRLRQDLAMDSLELAILTVKLEAETGVDVFAGGIVTTIGEIEDRLLGQ